MLGRHGPPKAQERPSTTRAVSTTADPGVGADPARWDHKHTGSADAITITDSADNFDATTVEGALAELAGDSYVVVKAANQSVTSSTTIVDDDELFGAVAANETWIYHLMVFYTSDTAGDIDVTMTGPAGSTLVWTPMGADGGLTVGVNVNTYIERAGGTESTHGGSATSHGLLIMGSISNGATAGNLRFRWAQNASSGTATVVRAGSFLFMRRVA